MLTGHSDFIAQWALTDPSRIALSEVETGRTLRYGQLNERAWRLVHALAAQGVQPGDRVALIARNGIETFELVVACLRLGAAFTPLNWRLAVPELADIVDRCHPKALVYDQASREAAGALLETRQGTRGVALGEPDGVVVDTHVARLSTRLDLTREKTPEKIERDLMKLVPREDWTLFSHWLIWHGRRRCSARKPDCAGCEIKGLCPTGRQGAKA